MNNSLQTLYGENEKVINNQIDRYNKLSKKFENIFGTKPAKFFSSPGRTEISGNHTDHNHGTIASVNLDSIACAEADSSVEIYLVI
jgi:galactokinase